jgi:hypothetical protein
MMFDCISRRALGAFAGIALSAQALAQSDPLPSWNEGTAKQAIIALVKETTTPGSPKFVDPAARIATFDQDGTTWVEQPLYSQVMFAFHQLGVISASDPELKNAEPFKTVLSGDRAAIGKLTLPEIEKILAVTHTGMTVQVFRKSVQDWIATAEDPRFHRLYTDLVYLPMLEVMQYFTHEWLQNLHRHGRWSGIRTRVCRKGLWHSARTNRGFYS